MRESNQKKKKREESHWCGERSEFDFHKNWKQRTHGQTNKQQQQRRLWTIKITKNKNKKTDPMK